jgi:hypothetical protein
VADQCCNGTCRRKSPIRVVLSDLSGRAYAVTRWRPWGTDGFEAIEKHDVTDDVTFLMQKAWNEGWDACAGAERGVEVLNPYAPQPTEGGTP